MAGIDNLLTGQESRILSEGPAYLERIRREGEEQIGRVQTLSEVAEFALALGISEVAAQELVDAIRFRAEGAPFEKSQELGRVFHNLREILPPEPTETTALPSSDSGIEPIEPAAVGVSSLRREITPSAPVPSEPSTQPTDEVEHAAASLADVVTSSEQDQKQLGKPLIDLLGRYVEASREELEALTKDDDFNWLFRGTMQVRGTLGGRTSLDYKIVFASLAAGMDIANLASVVETSPAYLSTALKNFANKILEHNGGKKLTLNELREWALKTDAQLESTPVAKPAHPVPAPPKTPMPSIVPPRPTAAEAPVAVPANEPEAERPNADERARADRLEALQVALEKPDNISPRRWRRTASTELFDRAGRAGWQPAETQALWERIHRDEADDKYKEEITDAQRSALQKLQQLQFKPEVREVLKKSPRGGQIALATLLNMTAGVRTLNDVTTNLQREDPTISINVAERILTQAVLDVLGAGGA